MTQATKCRGVIRFEFECLSVLAHCPFQFPPPQICEAPLRVDDERSRVKLIRMLDLGGPFVNSPLIEQTLTVQLTSRRVVGIQGYRALEHFFRSCPVPIVVVFNNSKHRLWLGQLIIEGEGLLRCGLGQIKGLTLLKEQLASKSS